MKDQPIKKEIFLWASRGIRQENPTVHRSPGPDRPMD